MNLSVLFNVMYCDIHTDFILTPLFDIFKDGVNACAPLSKGIENSSLGEYFLQSLFLRLTGAQEQKMKCICWAIASNDYRYRYEYQNVKHYGECSDYSDFFSLPCIQAGRRAGSPARGRAFPAC